MPRSERAKQFMPFAALRGFGSVITEKESVAAERPILSDDETERLNAVFSVLKKGDVVKIEYYENGFIKEIEGAMTGFDAYTRTVTIVKTRIGFDDVLKAELAESSEKPS